MQTRILLNTSLSKHVIQSVTENIGMAPNSAKGRENPIYSVSMIYLRNHLQIEPD